MLIFDFILVVPSICSRPLRNILISSVDDLVNMKLAIICEGLSAARLRTFELLLSGVGVCMVLEADVR